MHTQFSPTISKHLRTIATVVTSASIIALVTLSPLAASADTAPPAGTPATVSADPLPTVQVNGIVWAQVTVGNTVYATGRFSQARPAGIALGGAGTVTRTNLVAFDLSTGVMTGFNHSLTGGTGTVEGRAIAASPDGKRLYVGGRFAAVDGQVRNNFAAFDLPAGTLASGFAAGPNNTVKGIAASNTQVYIGGAFTTAGGQTHNKIAAYDTSGSILAGWAPSITNVAGTISGPYVSAMVIAGNKLIFGGYFNQLNGQTYYSSGAVSLTTGAPIAWGSQSSTYPIRHQLKSTAAAGQGVGITNMATDGTQVYLSNYNYAGTNSIASPEGPAAISPVDGHIIWINDCHGDTYSVYPVGQVLYSVGHPHDCLPAGTYSDRGAQRALAQTTNATGVNGPTTNISHGYADFGGLPRSTQLNWYPTLNTGTFSGSGQASWSITGNANYISLGGEFTRAENKPQQGLVRYGLRAVATNKVGPKAYVPYGVTPLTTANSSGQATIAFDPTSDEDNGILTYRLYRDGGTTAILTKTIDTRFWSLPRQTFTDSGLAAGSVHRYRMTVTDPLGNVTTTYSLYDDNNVAAVYSGNWINSQGRGNGDFGGGIHYTADNGAFATFSFTGTTIGVVMEKNSDRGDISVSVDGGAATVMNINAPSFIPQQTVYTKSGLTNAAHTVRVTKVSGTYMDIDGFLVKP